MPVLQNNRHELFAQGIAKGKKQRDAYKDAGFEFATDDAGDANASRLMADDAVSARVTEIHANAAKRAEISIEKVLLEMAKIGFADIRRAVKWSSVERPVNALPDGDDSPLFDEGDGTVRIENEVLLVPSADLDEETAAAISEVTQTKQGLRIKFHDKRAALVDIGRHLGMFIDRTEHTGANGGPIETKELSQNELARRVAFVLASGMKEGEK